MKKVVLSKRAYLSMLAEVYERVETETGGILLGHREGDTWYVLESVEPGPKSIFTPTYFEYDDAYVTYRANKIRRLYKCSIQLLGLWHRHPSLMKVFSSTDDGTNKKYADLLGGAISGIVTLGNGFEITMYYVPSNVRYEEIECVVDDEQIPEDYLAYYDTEYYKELINDVADKTYGNKYRQNVKKSTPQQYDSIEEVYDPIEEVIEDKVVQADRSNISSDGYHKKSVWSVLKRIVEDVIIAEDTESDDRQLESEADSEETENEVAFIFDTIEPEIEYLQRMESEGKIRSTIAKKKTRKGKNVLILKIKDLRQEEGEGYTGMWIFFVNNGQVWVRDKDGNTRLYTNNIINTIPGGEL